MTLYDWRPRLTGQGTHGPLRVPPRQRGHMHLWDHVTTAPVGNTLVVFKNGEVMEGYLFGEEVYGNPDIHRVFIGGYDHRCDPVEDPFSFEALGRAGYSCCKPTDDVYGDENDRYASDDTYLEGGCC